MSDRFLVQRAATRRSEKQAGSFLVNCRELGMAPSDRARARPFSHQSWESATSTTLGTAPACADERGDDIDRNIHDCSSAPNPRDQGTWLGYGPPISILSDSGR